MVERTPRQIILRALQNVGRNSELFRYLFDAVKSIKVDNVASSAVTIATNAPDRFAFLKDMFPSITLLKKDEPDSQTLFFEVCGDKEKEKEKEKGTGKKVVDPFVNPLYYTFSFFPQKPPACPSQTHISIGLGEDQRGVYISPIDGTNMVENPLQLYPYFLCITDRLESVQAFIEIIAGHYKTIKLEKGENTFENTVEIFLPLSSYPLLSGLKYNKLILSVFGTIELFDDEKNTTTITTSNRGRTLRIKPITDTVIASSFVKYSGKHILIDYKEYKDSHQVIVDTISNFRDKMVWCTRLDTNPLFQDLEKYTMHKTLKKLRCFQFKKAFPVLDLRILIKLALFLPDVQDIMKIVCGTQNWYKKVYELIDIK
jgi:hypothetical protein